MCEFKIQKQFFNWILDNDFFYDATIFFKTPCIKIEDKSCGKIINIEVTKIQSVINSIFIINLLKIGNLDCQ
jgi:hypothetical protein